MQNKIDNLTQKLHNNNNKNYIVHGIGTNCGKCNIIKNLNAKIKNNFAIKPLLSGFYAESVQESDNFHLLYAQFGRPPSLQEIKEISAYILIEPLSPDIASWHENIEIDFKNIISFCQKWITKVQELQGNLFIETAGGVCSPSSSTHTMADISKALAGHGVNIENILVSTPYLGAISHTISALHILKFDTLIINRCDDDFLKSIINHLPYDIEIYVIH
jgi:dethiobiotin synthase